MQRFALSDTQAQAILDLRLQRLTNMELRLIQKEYESVVKLIEELESILASQRKLYNLIKRELMEIRDSMAGKRRTQIIRADPEIVIDAEDVSVAEDVTVCVCEGLRVRRCPTRLFSASQIAEDKPLYTVHTRSDQRIRLFTNLGAMFVLTASDIPETRPTARAANLSALLPLEKNETVVAAFPDTQEGDYLFYTALGNVKRTATSEYSVRVKRTAAISLAAKDTLVSVQLAGTEDILLITRLGMSIRFAADSVPSTGRVTGGVKGIKLERGDSVLFAAQLPDEGELLTVTDRGYGKRSLLFDYEPQGRNGKGLKTFDFKKNGSNGTCLTAVMHVTVPHEILLIQRHGTKTRLSTDSVHIEPRAGKGVMLVPVVLDDDVMTVERVGTV